MRFKMPTSNYGNMHPTEIDYKFIDPPLRELIKEINRSSWAKTIGSCAGKAYHNKKGFYLLIEVLGIKGIRRLLRWLSLSHLLGFNASYEGHILKDYALPEARLIFPNLLHSNDSITGSLIGKAWFRFVITLHLGRSPLNKAQTRGGIKALELGWNNIENKWVRKGIYKKKELSPYMLNR